VPNNAGDFNSGWKYTGKLVSCIVHKYVQRFEKSYFMGEKKVVEKIHSTLTDENDE
jgi:hypothetical protein